MFGQQIGKPEVMQYFDTPPVGTWIWEKPLSKASELGSLLWQLQSKGTTKIVKLEISYDPAKILTDPTWGRRIRLFHTGEIGVFTFHADRPEALIVTGDIPADNVRLIRTYDFMNIVEPENY